MSMRLTTVETTRQACDSLAAGQQRRDDRDERRRQRPRRDQLEDQVGQAECGEERVELARQQAGVADDDEADVAEQARDEERARDDDPGPGEGLAGGHGAGSRRARGWASR